MKRFYSMGEVAEVCGVSVTTAIRWFDEGQLVGYRLPGRGDRRVPHDYLARFIRDNRLDKAKLPGRETG